MPHSYPYPSAQTASAVTVTTSTSKTGGEANQGENRITGYQITFRGLIGVLERVTVEGSQPDLDRISVFHKTHLNKKQTLHDPHKHKL